MIDRLICLIRGHDWRLSAGLRLCRRCPRVEVIQPDDPTDAAGA